MGNELNKSMNAKTKKSYLTDRLLHSADKLFAILDTDGNKTIERAEVIERFQHHNRNKEEADRFFRILDRDQSGLVTYEEFLDFWLQLRSKSTEDQVIERLEGFIKKFHNNSTPDLVEANTNSEDNKVDDSQEELDSRSRRYSVQSNNYVEDMQQEFQREMDRKQAIEASVNEQTLAEGQRYQHDMNRNCLKVQ